MAWIIKINIEKLFILNNKPSFNRRSLVNKYSILLKVKILFYTRKTTLYLIKTVLNLNLINNEQIPYAKNP